VKNNPDFLQRRESNTSFATLRHSSLQKKTKPFGTWFFYFAQPAVGF
jgi:hypothetical protein